MQLTFNGKYFIFNRSRGTPLPLEMLFGGWHRDLDGVLFTPSYPVAARLRDYADSTAKREINRVMISVTPWTGRIPYPKNLSPDKKQLTMARWALDRNRSYLAGRPGVGKTIVAALIINAIHAKGDKSVVYVAPPGLCLNVLNELNKWCPDKRIYVCNGKSISSDIRLAYDIFLVPDSFLIRAETYHLFQSLRRDRLASTVIIDEAHRYKSPEAKRTLALLGEKALTRFFPRTILMSGSPMPNRPMELYPMLKRLAPETIGFRDFHAFAHRYCDPRKVETYGGRWAWDYTGESNFDELKKNVQKNFMLSVDKSHLGLPPKTEEIVIIGENLPAKVAKLDAKILRELSPEKLERDPGKDDQISTYLRELGMVKVNPALKYIRDCMESVDSAIVFAHHRDVVKLLVNGLRKYRPLVISGDTKRDERFKIAETFQKEKRHRILVGNIQACGLGFNLTKAQLVIFVEFSWVPGDNMQASDRAHRRGQKNEVLVQYLVFKNSIDRAKMETNLRKQKVTLAL